MDFSLDGFLEFAGEAINSVGQGVESIFSSVGDLFSGIDLDGLFQSDDDSSAVFERAFGSVGGIDDSDYDLGDSLAASPIAKASSASVFDKGLSFVKQNPELTKVGAGLIAGAVQGYQTDKALEQQDRQFRDRLDAEKEMLRDRYKYDTNAQAEVRKQRQDAAYGIFKGAK